MGLSWVHEYGLTGFATTGCLTALFFILQVRNWWEAKKLSQHYLNSRWNYERLHSLFRFAVWELALTCGALVAFFIAWGIESGTLQWPPGVRSTTGFWIDNYDVLFNVTKYTIAAILLGSGFVYGQMQGLKHDIEHPA